MCKVLFDHSGKMYKCALYLSLPFGYKWNKKRKKKHEIKIKEKGYALINGCSKRITYCL